jgi:hypothetical protein
MTDFLSKKLDVLTKLERSGLTKHESIEELNKTSLLADGKVEMMIYFILLLTVFPVMVYRRVLKYIGAEVSSNRFTSDKIFNDIIYTIPDVLALYFIGNYVNTFTVLSSLFVFMSLFAYTAIENLIPGMHISLNTILYSNDIAAVMTRVSIFTILCIAATIHIYLCYKEGIWMYYIAMFIISVFIFFIVPYIIEYHETGYQVQAHLHHVYIAYILAFFTRFEHPASKFFANILLAVYIQGISAYGRVEGAFDIGN